MKNELQDTILTLLSCKGSMSGYDVAKTLDTEYMHVMHQQVYKEIRGMLKDGLVESEYIAQDGKPDKKIISITYMGIDAIHPIEKDDGLSLPLSNFEKTKGHYQYQRLRLHGLQATKDEYKLAMLKAEREFFRSILGDEADE